MGSHRELPAHRARLLNHAIPGRRARAGLAGGAVLALGCTAVVVLALGNSAAPMRLATAAGAASGEASLAPEAPASSSRWSVPAPLTSCPAAGGPSIVFPQDSPSHGTGAGALVWEAAGTCAGGEDARIAPLSADDLPAPEAGLRGEDAATLELRGPLLASGAPHGQVLLAGYAPGRTRAARLAQGPAAGPFSTLSFAGGASAPLTLASAYLGDVALASPPQKATAQGGPTDALAVHVERFYARGFGRSAVAGSAAGGAIQGAVLALDYRSDALAVWLQRGTLYSQLLPATGATGPIQRLARAGPHVVISALLSDDERAIVAWAQQTGAQTALYVDRSSLGVRFGAPELIERFGDPAGLPSPAGSPRLVRLSTEAVVLAWAGEREGRWVLHSAPIDIHGMGAVATLDAVPTATLGGEAAVMPGATLGGEAAVVPGASSSATLGGGSPTAPGSGSTGTFDGDDGQALLDDLTAGPEGDALAVWSVPAESPGGVPETDRQALFAARISDAPQRRTVFGAPEELAVPGPVDDATAAFDPDSGRALVAWRAAHGVLEYTAGAPSGP